MLLRHNTGNVEVLRVRLRRSFDRLGVATAIAVAAVVLFLPAAAWSSSPLVVTNTSDSGAGSLRQAIVDANANPGSTIAFNIPTSDPGFSPSGGWFTIAPLSPLPSLTADGTTIDGSTQTAFTGNTNPAGPEVFLDGRSQVGQGSGIWILSSSNVVEALAVSGFPGPQIVVGSCPNTNCPVLQPINGNAVRGNYVGTDPTGASVLTTPSPNALNGGIGVIYGATNTVIGGTTPEARNVISGSSSYGIELLLTTGVVIEGNYIGTNATGTAALGNFSDGIRVGITSSVTIGGTSPGAGNVISGNGTGHDCCHGTGAGIGVTGVDGLSVEGNLIGTDAHGTSAIPNITGGVVFFGNNGPFVDTVIGGATTAARNVISGNAQSGISIGPGPTGSTATIISGNYIGTDASGTVAVPNAGSGVDVEAPDTVVGGTTAGERNVISGNMISGVAVSGSADGTVVEGNYIGTTASGTSALGNALDNCQCDPRYAGVDVTGGSNSGPSAITIGGTAPGAGNLISGNDAPAVGLVNTGTTAIAIEGNLLGTDASGAQEIGGGGIDLFANVAHAVIGGTTAAARNVMGGVFVGVGSTGTVISGNYIGTNAAGTAMFSGQGQAIGLAPGSVDTVIGGTAPGAGNLIESGSGWAAVAVSPSVSGTIIQGNLIGTDSTGTHAIASTSGTGGGISVEGGDGTLIGGATPGARNTIAFNGGNGVEVDGGTGNTISRNSIFSNGGLGIDLGGDGVTLNDPGDTDTGPNNLQNFPVLTSAGIVAGQLVVQGTIDTPSPQSVTIEIYANAVPAPGADPSGYGEGAVFLGTATPSSSGSFTVSLPAVASGTRISATATDAAGDTSEFAKDATGATTSLCTLTTQFVQSSSNYQRLKPAQKRAVDLLATAACQFVAAIAPRLNASQKAALVAGYKKAVQGLAHDGWLTAEQSAILISLASSL